LLKEKECTSVRFPSKYSTARQTLEKSAQFLALIALELPPKVEMHHQGGKGCNKKVVKRGYNSLDSKRENHN